MFSSHNESGLTNRSSAACEFAKPTPVQDNLQKQEATALPRAIARSAPASISIRRMTGRFVTNNSIVHSLPISRLRFHRP